MQPLLTRASFKASSLHGSEADESKTSFSSSFCYSLDDDPFHFHCPWKKDKKSFFVLGTKFDPRCHSYVLRESLMTWSFIFITSRNNLWRQFIKAECRGMLQTTLTYLKDLFFFGWIVFKRYIFWVV